MQSYHQGPPQLIREDPTPHTQRRFYGVWNPTSQHEASELDKVESLLPSNRGSSAAPSNGDAQCDSVWTKGGFAGGAGFMVVCIPS